MNKSNKRKFSLDLFFDGKSHLFLQSLFTIGLSSFQFGLEVPFLFLHGSFQTFFVRPKLIFLGQYGVDSRHQSAQNDEWNGANDESHKDHDDTGSGEPEQPQIEGVQDPFRDDLRHIKRIFRSPKFRCCFSTHFWLASIWREFLHELSLAIFDLFYFDEFFHENESDKYWALS